MGFLDKAKSAAEQAAQKAKEGAEFAAQKAKETAEDVQTKRELASAYDELGRTTFELVESGALTHEALQPLAAKIRDLQGKLEEAATADEQVGTPV
jgi:hypothetical protein